jgi:hypothetical protein
VVVLLSITEAKALTAGCLSMGFLSMWCGAAAEVVGRSCRLVARVVGLQNLYL